ncbi:AAEL000363-PA [Aedes aegypti]|uniref:AAEL000363-PA n=1 Tax=Aedes aegypti TaxID=7159 RepID=Q17PK6_AEDAE|nr:AAEL000363-PA [Aedes aegypti]
MKLLVLVVFIASICYACAADPPCADPNEVYDCCGSACQRTCNNELIYILCIKKCVPGCFCRDGYVRQYDNGPCVRLEECPCITTTTPGYGTVTFM